MSLKFKLILICVGIGLLAYGVSYGYKKFTYYKERSEITEKQDEIVAELEKADIEHTKTEDDLYKQLAEKERLVSVLDKQIGILEDQRTHIVVPTDPGDLVSAWGRVGIGARVNRRTSR